jgi:DNA mismatch endonuclease, patch repair protein
MPDFFAPAKRSQIMRAIKSCDTNLEVAFRTRLWASGLRYKLKNRLPGKPDLVFPGARVSVFVDSCFFHACPKHCRFPKSNQGYWAEKLRRNQERDRRVTIENEDLGWKVIRVWEHSIRNRPGACVTRIRNAILRRRKLSATMGGRSGPAKTL